MQRGQDPPFPLCRLKLCCRTPANPEDQRFDPIRLGPGKFAEILAGHDRLCLHHSVRAEAGAEEIRQLRGEPGGIVSRPGIRLEHRNGWHQLLGNSRSLRFTGGNSTNSIEQQLARGIAIAAHGQLELGLIRDDVVLGPGVEAADCDHCGIERTAFPADQRLQPHHDRARQHDWVFGRMRISPVPAQPAHRDIDAVDVGESKARAHPDHAARQIAGIVECQRIIGLGELGEQAIVKHRLGAEVHFLCRLADHDQRAGPLRLASRQQPRRRDPRGHMRVVSAGVHDAAFHARSGGAAHLGGIGEAGLFDHRQRVHIGTDQHSRAWPIAQHGDDAGLADFFSHLKPCCPRGFGHDRGRADFLEAQLGVLVKIAIDRHQARQVSRDLLLERIGPGGSGERQQCGGGDNCEFDHRPSLSPVYRSGNTGWCLARAAGEHRVVGLIAPQNQNLIPATKLTAFGLSAASRA